MTIAAFWESRHHAGWMGRTMAVLANGHRLMILLMAEGACKGRMFGLAGSEKA